MAAEINQPAVASLQKAVTLLDVLRAKAGDDRLGAYDPYPFQLEYHACRDHTGERMAQQYLLSAANQIGKTESAGADVAYHATGEYPEWWGDDWPRLDKLLRKHPDIWCGGENNDTVRDIAQSQLFGKASDPMALGTGWIPKSRIVGNPVRKVNVPNAFDQVMVKHKGGFNVTITFKAYKADILDWAGVPVALIWLDEEPPQAYYGQALARTAATGGIVKMSFTPEKGQTQLISQFKTSLMPGQRFAVAGWKHCKHPDGRSHLTEEVMAQLRAAFPPHEVKMRTEGIPVLGAGMVFPLSQDLFSMESIQIPKHWPKICGMDFGSGGVNHPTAGAWWAFDRDAKVAYLYSTYKSSAQGTADHASAMRSRGAWIPVAWPHDGHRKEAYANDGVANAYRKEGLQMLPSHFIDPETGTNQIEPGVLAMFNAMNGTDPDGWRIKVFDSCHDFWAEFPLYHRHQDTARIVDQNDDVMSAARIGYRSMAQARAEAMVDGRSPRVVTTAQGVGDNDVFGWGQAS